MIIRSTHRTLYLYRTPSIDSHNEVRLKPLTDLSQICRSFSLKTDPATRVLSYDEPGGTVHYFGVRGDHNALEIVAEAEVETLLTAPLKDVDLVGDDWAVYDRWEVRQRYAEYLAPSPYVGHNAKAAAIALEVKVASSGSVANFLIDLARHIYQEFDYDPDVTHVHTTVDEVLSLRAGVCQDFAHLMIACCRSLHIPARYVSGYLYTRVGEGMRGSSAMHAWVECPLPDGRWLALDPTNDVLANENYVRVHVGRDYSEVSPTRGIYVGAPAESMEVTLRVEAVLEPVDSPQPS